MIFKMNSLMNSPMNHYQTVLWLQCDIVWRCLTAISLEVFPVTSGLKAILWCSETPRGGYRCQLGSPIDEGTRWLPFVLRRSISWNDWGQDNRAILVSWMSWMCGIWVSDLVMRRASFFLVGFDCMPLDSLRNETNKLTRAWRMEVWRKACTEALVATSSLELYLSYCRIALVSHSVSASSQKVQYLAASRFVQPKTFLFEMDSFLVTQAVCKQKWTCHRQCQVYWLARLGHRQVIKLSNF